MLKQILFIGILVSDRYQITVYAYTRTNTGTIEMTAYRPDVCNRFYFLKSKDVYCLSDGKIMSIILLKSEIILLKRTASQDSIGN